MAFPQYLWHLFQGYYQHFSYIVLETYTSPSAFLEADKQEIIDISNQQLAFNTYAQNKGNAIIQAAIDNRLAT